MKRLFLALIILASLTSAQQNKESRPTTPCDHPIIKKARTEGLNSLTFKESLQFVYRAIQCKRYAKKTGEEIDFRSLFKQKQKQNFEEARQLSGVGTCCLIVTVLIVFYSYYGYMMGAD